MWWTLGLWPIGGGLLLLYLSYQKWYIKWVKERMPISEEKIVRMERQMAIYLIIFGSLFTLKDLI